MTAGHWTQIIFHPSKIAVFYFTLTEQHLSFQRGKAIVGILLLHIQTWEVLVS